MGQRLAVVLVGLALVLGAVVAVAAAQTFEVALWGQTASLDPIEGDPCPEPPGDPYPPDDPGDELIGGQTLGGRRGVVVNVRRPAPDHPLYVPKRKDDNGAGALLTALGWPSDPGATYSWTCTTGWTGTGEAATPDYFCTTAYESDVATVTYTHPVMGSATNDSGPIHVIDAELTLDGLGDEQEEDPGGGLIVGGPRKRLDITLAPEDPNTILPFGDPSEPSDHDWWTAKLQGGDEVAFYDAETEGNQLTDLTWGWEDEGGEQYYEHDGPSEVWVEAVQTGDCSIRLTFSFEMFWLYPNPGSATAEDTVKVTCVGLDLAIEGTDPDTEDDPGAFIPFPGGRKRLSLYAAPSDVGPVTLTVTAGGDKVDFYAEETGGQSLGDSLLWFAAEYVPSTVYVQPLEVSGTCRDVTIELALPEMQDLEDIVRLTCMELAHIECNGQYVEDSTIVLLEGTIYTFRAIPAPAGAGWPPDMPVWDGLGSGVGEEKEITFDFHGEGYELEATCGNTKTVTIDVIRPEIDSVEITGSNHEPIYDVPFSGWQRARTGQDGLNEPGCYKQGAPSQIAISMWAPKALTFPASVDVKGEVDSDSDDELMGGDFPATSAAFATSWPSSPMTLTSSGDIPALIQSDSYVDIDFYYRVPSGTNQWLDADDCGWLTVYVIWDEPAWGMTPGAGGTFAFQHFTLAHLDDAVDWAEGTSGESEAASQVCSELSRTILHDHGDHSDVDLMWSYLESSNGQCGCWASGMAYVMRCLGFDFGVAYCNLRPSLNNGYYISGTATCPTCGNVVRLGWSGWTWNSWQGACYGALASPLEDTKCYSVQHDYQRTYWEIGNDKNDSQTPPRPGIAFTYAWYDADSGGGSQQFVQAVEGEGACPGGIGHGLYNLDPDPPLVGN